MVTEGVEGAKKGRDEVLSMGTVFSSIKDSGNQP